MPFQYTLYVIGCLCCQSVDVGMDEAHREKERTNSWGISKVQTMSIYPVATKVLRDRASRFTATCNQMNASCEQMRSKKGPQCACSIRRDVGQAF